jgi:hypothetical protein
LSPCLNTPTPTPISRPPNKCGAGQALPPRPLVPERSDFFEGDAPAADKVAAFLTRALEATGNNAPDVGAALVPWICNALLSNHSVKAYGRDSMDFVRHMQAQGVSPLEVTEPMRLGPGNPPDRSAQRHP